MKLLKPILIAVLTGLAWFAHADTLLGTYTINYRYNAAGRYTDQSNPDYTQANPCFGNTIPPGPVYVPNTTTPGQYKLITVSGGGCGVWSGDCSGGTFSVTGHNPGDEVIINHTSGQIVLYYWDWVAGDNDPNVETTISVYFVQGPAQITLNDGGVTDLEVVARDTQVSFANEIEDLFPSLLPFDQGHEAIQGDSHSIAMYHLGQDGFTITSSGARAGLLDSRANVQPMIFFSVSVDTPYTITGTLSVDDPGLTAKYASLTVTLTDIDTSRVLFNNDQESFGIVDQCFELGGVAGNLGNELSGSPTGLLLGGHRYRLYYGTSIYAGNSGDSASYVGHFEFKLGASGPFINCPSNIVTVADSGVCSAVVNYTVNATSNSAQVVCAPPSGSTFPKGTTIVNCQATDTAGNTSACSFTVTVQDNQPPEIVCPNNILAGCDVNPLVPVVYSVTATDNCDPAPVVTMSPPSGSGFPLGTTIVNCTAQDADGNQSSCSFSVTRAPLGFTGFLSPIGGADASGGSSEAPVRTFKMGSVVPVKFNADCGGSLVTTGVHTLQVSKWTDQTNSTPPIDATPSDSATVGDQFRLSDGQWIFNLDTKAGLSIGKWELMATLSDGSKHSAWIQLK